MGIKDTFYFMIGFAFLASYMSNLIVKEDSYEEWEKLLDMEVNENGKPYKHIPKPRGYFC